MRPPIQGSCHVRGPDAEVIFELTSLKEDGSVRRVLSGYRPAYNVKPDYSTSVSHNFIEIESVSTGDIAPSRHERARCVAWEL